METFDSKMTDQLGVLHKEDFYYFLVVVDEVELCDLAQIVKFFIRDPVSILHVHVVLEFVKESLKISA